MITIFNKSHQLTKKVAVLMAVLFLSIVTVNAQNITIDMKDVSIKNVMKEIQRQTDYKFVYNDSQVDLLKSVSVKVSNLPLKETLDEVFVKNDIRYNIIDKQIVLAPKEFKKEKNAQAEKVNYVKGVVRDDSSAPLAGCYVFIEGTSTGTITDAEGKYEIAYKDPGASLTFAFTGMDTQTIKPVSAILNVQMKMSAQRLDEVTVTGYQVISREKVTGATTMVKADKLSERYTPNIMDNLEGRVAGMVTYSGKTMIRGISSFSVSSTPLLVVDGLPVEGSIEDLNPYDIESVTLLKDAAAAAIYGARASNGIIVVVTKKAKDIGRIQVDVAANYTVYQKRNLDYAYNFYMTPEEQVAAESNYYQYYFSAENTEVTDPVSTATSDIASGNVMSPVKYAYYQFAKGDITQAQLDKTLSELSKNNFAKEYQDNVLKNRLLHQYNVSVRNRSKDFQSNLVLNYKYDNQGIINAVDNQVNILYKGAYDMTKWLTINFGVNGILSKSKESNSGFASDPFNVPAYMKLLNSDGSYTSYSPTDNWNAYNTKPEQESGLKSMHFNHMQELYYDQSTSERQSARYQGELLFRIIDGLSASAQFVYEDDRRTTSTYSEEDSFIMRFMRNVYTDKANGQYTYMTPENGGRLATVNTGGKYWTGRGQINFNRVFDKKHSIDFLAGLEFRQTKYKGTRGLMLGWDDQLQSHATTTVDYVKLKDLNYTNFFLTNFYVSSFYSRYIANSIGPVIEETHRYASGYANLTYTYDNRYSLFGSFRKDYADLYGANAKLRGKPLWSVGAGWNLHNEKFMGGVDVVNNLKLRASYGKTGNIYQGATSYMTGSTVASSGVPYFNYVMNIPYSAVISPANPYLTWEKTTTVNAGVDFALFNNRLKGSVDLYDKQADDVFYNKLLEKTTGFSSMFMNYASIHNSGVEITLSYDWFRAKNQDGFNWNTFMTYAANNNEILSVENQATTAKAYLNSYKVGYPTSAIFSYRFAGIDQGKPTWYGQSGSDGEPVILTGGEAEVAPVDILAYSGQTDPKFTASMENVFSYKRFSLGFMMIYYGGHKMRVLQEYQIYGLPYSTIPSYLNNAWTPTNTETTVPAYGRYADMSSILGNETASTDIYVQPADFIKIRNIVLGYTLPNKWLSRIGLSSAQIKFQIDNPKPLWVKNDVGIDPETLGARLLTSYIFGININF
jgi:TonB-linked SusC/RagA family outer membrane protein